MNQSDLEVRIKKLEIEAETIKSRNARVEAAKAWESSKTRILGVSLATYVTMNLILWSIGGPFPPVHALVPTAGFVLSTLSLPMLKRRWIKRRLLKDYRAQHTTPNPE